MYRLGETRSNLRANNRGAPVYTAHSMPTRRRTRRRRSSRFSRFSRLSRLSRLFRRSAALAFVAAWAGVGLGLTAVWPRHAAALEATTAPSLTDTAGPAESALPAFPDFLPEELRGRFVTIGSHRIHVVDRGSGEAVVLLHGFGGWVWTFRGCIAPLAAHRRVVAVDLLGFGLSDKPADADYSLTAEARLVLAVLDSLGIARADIVGHSYGGGVAAAMGLLAPARVRSVTMANSITLKYGRFSVADGMLRSVLRSPVLRAPALWLAAPRDADFAQIIHEGYAHPGRAGPEVLAGFLYPYHLPGARKALPAMALTAGAGQNSPLVFPQRLTVPVFVLWGREDPWFTWGRGYQLAARIPGSCFAIVPDAGHLLFDEAPASCVRLLNGFLDGLDARGVR